jgi:ABC-2 type transport system ATP-binding protein
VEGVSKRFRIYHQRNQTLKQTVLSGGRSKYEEFWALKDINLEITEGSTFGLIGENGSGKSTLLKCIAGIYQPNGGRVSVEGRLASLLELGAGFHPEYTGRENIYLNGALLGLSRREVEAVLGDIIAFSELERFIDNPVKTYSSGMYARLGFSIAVHVDPDVLMVDEILAVGDESFQRRCYGRIEEMKAQGKTMILVSHALDTIRDHCKLCAWLDHGEIQAVGPVAEVVGRYLAEVRAREERTMEATAASVHREIPSGRDGVGVTSVSFVGPGGAGHQFGSGDDLEVRIEYHSPGERLTGASFAVEFIREDGVLAFSTSTPEDPGRAIPGAGVVSLRVPGLPLLDGLYRLSVSITDAESKEPYTILANAFPFRVTSNGSGAAERGVARLEHRWQLPVPV